MSATTSSAADRGHLTWLLTASAVLLLFTCLTLAWDYSQHSVQMDLSAFYAAGESLRLGLDPYTNNYPAVVTGTDYMRYSGFLYPPLTGLLFKAGAAFSYLKFKQLWDFSQVLWIFGTGAVVFAWLRRSGHASAAVPGVTLFFMAASAAFPLRLELERGQVDLMLLLLLTGGLMLVEVSGRAFLGGLLLGAAPLLKPHALYLLPFLLLRRRYSAIAGCALSLLLLVGVQYAIFPALSREYIADVLPRMDGNAVYAPAEWVKVTPEEWERLSRPAWDQPVQRGGHTYLREGFDNQLSVANASLARNIFSSASWTIRVGRSRISVAVYAMLFLIIFGAVRSPAIRWSHQRTLAFWIMALGVVLMAAPLTWTMATVWLLPAAAMIPAVLADEDLRAGRKRLILVILAAGLMLTLIDARAIYSELDRRGPALLMPFIKTGIFVIRLKPVLAEILVCAGLGLYVRSRPERVTAVAR